MSARTLAAIAVADFRDRVRRPAYLVTVLGAVALGYLAAPPGTSDYAMFKVGGFRGMYNSSYLGTLLALVGALWLALGGFYVVKNAITKDTSSGVGQILAASPVRNLAYLLGKFLSNLLILSTMAGFLALTALGMLLLRGESGTIDPIGLWLPFPLLCLPALAVSAAAAVLFESVRPLRGGAGNILWFFAFLAASAGGWFTIGLSEITASLRKDLLAQHPEVTETEISLGLTVEEVGLQTFRWSGLEVTGGLVAGQLGLLLAAVLIAAVPAVWFSRFDPSRARLPVRTAAGRPSDPEPVAGAFTATRPRTAVRRGNPFRRLVAGELRVLLKGQSRWWWAGLVGLTGLALFVPAAGGLNVVLLLAWIWPVLVWSRMGAHAFVHEVHVLVEAGSGAHRRALAEWLAGAAVAALAGAGPLIRMLLTGDGAGVAAWVAGAALIPALALLLGSLSRSPRLFQVVYLGLWYAVLNRTAAVDFLGAVRDGGELAGPSPVLVLGVAGGLLVGVLATKQLRHARR
jgi:hypothetical protein